MACAASVAWKLLDAVGHTVLAHERDDYERAMNALFVDDDSGEFDADLHALDVVALCGQWLFIYRRDLSDEEWAWAQILEQCLTV